MLAMLGGFFFEVNKNGYQDLEEKLSFEYAEHQKAMGFRDDENVGAHEEEFEVQGTLILQNIRSLETLKGLGKSKEPVLLVFGTGFCYWVTIRDINIKSNRFLAGGAPLKRQFSVKLKRYYYANSLFSQIFAAFG